jgi:hypothetical protein
MQLRVSRQSHVRDNPKAIQRQTQAAFASMDEEVRSFLS